VGAAALVYGTYLGSDGLQVAYGVDFDSKGNIFLTGFTSGQIFSAFGNSSKGSGPGNVDAFVVGISTAQPTLSAEESATGLGGSKASRPRDRR
jgi:hypothetical protein